MTTTYKYMTAKDWGIWYKNQTPKLERRPDPEAVLHHRAGNPHHNWDATRAFRAMNESAIARDYFCVAYDILVHEQVIGSDKIITIGEGRGPYMSGATKDRNEESEALCAIGYFHPGHSLSERPSAELLEGIALGFAWGINQGWISNNPNIYGHRSNPNHPNATTCPGDYLNAQLPNIRRRVAELTSLKELPMLGFQERPSSVDPRVLDTRGQGSNRDKYKLASQGQAQVKLPGAAGKRLAKVNLTATEAEGIGFFTCWSSGNRPVSSSLNYHPDRPIANEITVPLAGDGSFQIWSSARSHVVIDLVGYYDEI